MRRTFTICFLIFFSVFYARAQNEFTIFVSQGNTTSLKGVDPLWGFGFYFSLADEDQLFLEVDGDFGWGNINETGYMRKQIIGKLYQDLSGDKTKLLNRIAVAWKFRFRGASRRPSLAITELEIWRSIGPYLGLSLRPLGERKSSYFTISGLIGFSTFKNIEIIRDFQDEVELDSREEAVLELGIQAKYELIKNIWLDGDVNVLYPLVEKKRFWEVVLGYVWKPTEKFGLRVEFLGFGPEGVRHDEGELVSRIGISYFFDF